MLQHAHTGHAAGPPLGWPGSAADGQRSAAAGSPPGSLQQQQGRFGGSAGSSPPGHDILAPSGGPDTASAASQQTSLFPRFSPEAAAEQFSSGGSGGGATAAAQQQQQQAALKQNLQKLYGSLGLQHGSRSSLPDIQENEPQTSLPSDPPLAARLPLHGRAPSGRAMSDEDLFGMQDLQHQHQHHPGQAAAAGAGAGGAGGAGAGLGPPPAADLSLVGQLPAGSAQSRTLFVRNVDPSVPEDELRSLFEVRGQAAWWPRRRALPGAAS